MQLQQWFDSFVDVETLEGVYARPDPPLDVTALEVLWFLLKFPASCFTVEQLLLSYSDAINVRLSPKGTVEPAQEQQCHFKNAGKRLGTKPQGTIDNFAINSGKGWLTRASHHSVIAAAAAPLPPRPSPSVEPPAPSVVRVEGPRLPVHLQHALAVHPSAGAGAARKALAQPGAGLVHEARDAVRTCGE